MGRAALDEDAIRLIEEHNPDIEFDWTRILKGQGDPAPEPRRQPPPERRDRRPAPTTPAPPPPPRPVEEHRPVDAVAEAADDEFESEPETPPVPELDGPMTAAQMKLGSEGLSRLRGRYAEMLARISEKIADPVRQDELKTLAERLNPDAWVTADDVVAGLDSYEATFESLRSVVGHRRRRRRRRPSQQQEAE